MHDFCLYFRKYQDRVMRQRPETTPQDLDRIVKSRFKTWFKHKVFIYF